MVTSKTFVGGLSCNGEVVNGDADGGLDGGRCVGATKGCVGDGRGVSERGVTDGVTDGGRGHGVTGGRGRCVGVTKGCVGNGRGVDSTLTWTPEQLSPRHLLQRAH